MHRIRFEKKPNRDRVRPDAENQGENQACDEITAMFMAMRCVKRDVVPTNDNQPIASIATGRNLFGNC
jgi:hypothetical protein